MADLVSGNLKEEKGAHSIQLVHSGGLLPRHATCCFQNRSDAADPGPQCTFGWKRAKTATPGTLGQPNDGVTVAISPWHSKPLNERNGLLATAEPPHRQRVFQT